MSSIKQIKIKTKSTQNLQKISKALEVISTIKLQKSKAKTQWLKEYFLDFAQLWYNVNQKISVINHEEDIKIKWKNLLILISTEKWLCWGINSKLFRYTYQKFTNENLEYFVIGKKWFEQLGRIWAKIVWYINLKDQFSAKDISPLISFFEINKSEYDNIYICFNYFKSILIQIPVNFQLWPLNKNSIGDFASQIEIKLNKPKENDNIIIEPDEKTIRNYILHNMLHVIIQSSIVQNKAWEHANRMIAMKTAKDNCQNFVKKLTLQSNKIRQWAITKEISEIVSAKIAIWE